MPSTQKALLLDKKFGNFSVGEISVHEPGPGELLIKVLSASLNPVDWKIQKYGILIQQYPAIVGIDIAGDVEEVGEGVTDFKKGDRVFRQSYFVNKFGAFQQYAIGLASTTAKIPANISYDEAATIPVALTTSYVGLYNDPPYGMGFAPPITPDTQGKYTGTPIVILGGASSVGQFAIQLAKLSGFSPIITTASLKHADILKSHGATHVVDRNLSTLALAAEVAKATSTPLKTVFDSISLKDTQETGLELLAPEGHLALVLPPMFARDVPDGKQVFDVVAGLDIPHNVALGQVLWHDNLEKFLKEGVIKPNRVEVLLNGLAGIPDGLARLENDQVSRLKLVAHPHENA